MATEMSVQEAREGFADALNRVAYGHDRVLIQRRGKPVAALIPVSDLNALEALEDRLALEAHQHSIAESKGRPVKDALDLFGELGL